MSTLINGMKMPKDGSWVTLRVFPDGQCFLYSWCGDDFDFMEHLTAVPVQPHGRLIDADALTNCLATLLQFPSNLVNGMWIVNTIREQPTVIPAEEET